MAIELSGQIVILDEAHNIEDSSRDAASSSTSQEEIQMAMQDCEKVSRAGTEPFALSGLVRSRSFV
jgi:Fanconi anemia group J protein